MGNKALNSIQLVAGCDWHRQVPPPLPMPPHAPHIVVWLIGGNIVGGKRCDGAGKKVSAGWGYALGRQHDIGLGPYHFAPNALLPLVWLGAGNKAEFASGTVLVPEGRMAVAMIPWVGINLQLDCQDFPLPPLPTSLCFASFNTVHASFTWGDFFGGLMAMRFDMAVTWAINGVLSVAGGVLGKILSKGASSAVSGTLRQTLRGVREAGYLKLLGGEIREATKSAFSISVSFSNTFTMNAFRSAFKAFPQALRTDYPSGASGWLLGTFAVGSPLGYSMGYTPGGRLGESGNNAINDSLSNYLSPPPSSPSSGGGAR